MSGTLYLLPNAVSGTPAAAVLPAETLAAARRIERFFAEAAKSARAALKAMDHPKRIAELTIEEIGHDPDPARIDAWLAPVLAGEDAAIISESGSPGIADPGAQIVSRAHALGIRVKPLVGPSSILLALMASGFDGQRFRFSGYLPIAADERKAAIAKLEAQSRSSETQLFIETPYRNTQMLESLLSTVHPSTRILVATDITGEAESIRMLAAADWLKLPAAARELPKLPTVFGLLALAAHAPRYAPEGAAKKGAAHKGRRDEARRGRGPRRGDAS